MVSAQENQRDSQNSGKILHRGYRRGAHVECIQVYPAELARIYMNKAGLVHPAGAVFLTAVSPELTHTFQQSWNVSAHEPVLVAVYVPLV